jgi:diguanylate cyclase (GGDEF)-like protein/PAS domain S-box-containing protein
MSWVLGGIVIGILLDRMIQLPKARRINKRINELERIFQLAENSKDIIYYFELKPEWKFKYISPSLDANLGEGLVQDSYQNPFEPIERIHPDDYETLLKKMTGNLDYEKPIIQRWRNKEGKYQWFEEYATPVYEKGKMVAIQGIIRNITKNIELQQELEYKSTHDSLTGLYNRQYFDKLMDTYNEKLDLPISLIICDLDNLKQMNDQFGHKRGDDLLCQAAQLLGNFTSEHTTLFRIGGDEFVFLVAMPDEKEVENLVQNIEREIEKHNMNNPHLPIYVSIGYAYTNSSRGKMEQLYIKADHHMYQQKSMRKSLV